MPVFSGFFNICVFPCSGVTFVPYSYTGSLGSFYGSPPSGDYLFPVLTTHADECTGSYNPLIGKVKLCLLFRD